MKGKIVVIFAVILAGLAIAVVTKSSLQGEGVDFRARDFLFYGVFDEKTIDNLLSENEIMLACESATDIFFAEPVGKEMVYGYSVLNKVKPTKVFKGNCKENEPVWVQCSNGIYNGFNWGISNIMQEGKQYLLILTHVLPETDVYNNLFVLGAIPCGGGDSFIPIDIREKYCYNELASIDFFTPNDEDYERVLNISKQIIDSFRYN